MCKLPDIDSNRVDCRTLGRKPENLAARLQQIPQCASGFAINLQTSSSFRLRRVVLGAKEMDRGPCGDGDLVYAKNSERPNLHSAARRESVI